MHAVSIHYSCKNLYQFSFQLPMNTCYSVSIFLFLYLFLLPIHIAFANNATSYFPLENIALNCGTNSSEQVSYNGRIWTGDAGSEYVSSNDEETNKSLMAKASVINASVPDVPYMNARVFYSPFAYRFNVTPGPKFVRLHFYPTSYSGLDVSKAFVSVTAGNFTLMHNLSVSLTTEYINKAYLMKEFIIHVSGTTLELTFSPSSNASDVYGFVNGIEVVSMPSNLYIQGDKAHIPLVGHDSVLYYIHNDSALETMYRINVGGDAIPAKYDTGMFRTWTTEVESLYSPLVGNEPYDMIMPILYPEAIPPYVAPELVYRTSSEMAPFPNPLINLNFNLSWLFSIDSGFNYLVRLHFCDVQPDFITKVNQIVFNIYLNNQTAMDGFDVIALSGGPGIPVYLDFVVMVPETSEGKQDLWVDLYPDVRSKPQYYTAFLNGVEIFKLSNWDGNLAGVNPIIRKSESVVPVPHVVASKRPKKITFIIVACGLSVGALGVSILFFLIAYVLKVEPRKVSWRNLRILIPAQVRKAHKSSFRHHLSMDEIRVATNNFDEALVIGIGGFGKVYKASFDQGSTFVAIKRSNPMSEQGALEFETEIQVLSQLRHHNLVSLLGHCQEDGEMILVYEYMSKGTLFDHLHLRSREDLPLSWTQRLETCIGVARGLHYLHTGTEHKFIHRDIKTSNILLDHNWVAKISDFGLSKAANPALVSTNVKGSVGYLDPEYFWSHKLTEKSDVYSFGVVLMEVLSAKPAVNPIEDDKHDNLVDWALYCYENGIATQLVDPDLEGKIATESFETYIEVAKKCLAEKGVERPTMSDVLQRLVLALQLQRNADIAPTRDAGNADLEKNSDLTPGIEFSEIMIPIGR